MSVIILKNDIITNNNNIQNNHGNDDIANNTQSPNVDYLKKIGIEIKRSSSCIEKSSGARLTISTKKIDEEFFEKLDKNFTFKPKLNAKSNLIAQNLVSFFERQSLHNFKRMEIVTKMKKFIH